MTRFDKNTTKAIRVWLTKNGFECSCWLGYDMEYRPLHNVIVIPHKYNEKYDTYFMAMLRKLGLEQDFDAITLSVLHELGHAETEEKFSDSAWDKCAEKKQALFDKSNTMPFEKYINKYWKVADENSANKWLVDFANNCADLVQDLEDIIFENIVQ